MYSAWFLWLNIKYKLKADCVENTRSHCTVELRRGDQFANAHLILLNGESTECWSVTITCKLIMASATRLKQTNCEFGMNCYVLVPLSQSPGPPPRRVTGGNHAGGTKVYPTVSISGSVGTQCVPSIFCIINSCMSVCVQKYNLFPSVTSFSLPLFHSSAIIKVQHSLSSLSFSVSCTAFSFLSPCMHAEIQSGKKCKTKATEIKKTNNLQLSLESNYDQLHSLIIQETPHCVNMHLSNGS